ncbi:MAG: hypothetical protein ACOYNC_15530 [Bacteroidales bacterium]
MKDTVICPNCEMGNAYFDGVMYVCDDCGHEWSDGSRSQKKGPFSFYEGDHSEFERFSNLREPFFMLKHGKIYTCKVESRFGLEDMTIMPLAFAKGKNKQFIMSDASRLFKKDPEFVREIILMDYEYIMNDGLEREVADDFTALTNVFATQEDQTFVGYDGEILFDFEETDLI